MITCQVCKKNAATVHITEIHEFHVGENAKPHEVEQQHVCNDCAATLNLPHAPLKGKTVDIWNLLKHSVKQSRQRADVACPDCGMTLQEFRARGRLGCPKDYEVFGKHLEPLLLRMHNAVTHVGRIPGVDAGEVERIQRIHSLREQLQAAVRDEEYEAAARLRDELRGLEGSEEELC